MRMTRLSPRRLGATAGIALAAAMLTAPAAAQARPALLLSGDYPATLTAKLPAGVTMRRKSKVTVVFARHGRTVLSMTLCDEADGLNGTSTARSAKANAVSVGVGRMTSRYPSAFTQRRASIKTLSRSVVVVRVGQRRVYAVLLVGGACVTSRPSTAPASPSVERLVRRLGGWLGGAADDPAMTPAPKLDPAARSLVVQAFRTLAKAIRVTDSRVRICGSSKCTDLTAQESADPVARYRADTSSMGDSVVANGIEYTRRPAATCWATDAISDVDREFAAPTGWPGATWRLSVTMAPGPGDQRTITWRSFWDDGVVVIDPLGRPVSVHQKTRHVLSTGLTADATFAYPESIPHDIPSPVCPPSKPTPDHRALPAVPAAP